LPIEVVGICSNKNTSFGDKSEPTLFLISSIERFEVLPRQSFSPQTSSGSAKAIISWFGISSLILSSTSTSEIFSPPEIITSSVLPLTLRNPADSSQISALSNQPSIPTEVNSPFSDKYPLAIIGPVNLINPSLVSFISTPSNGF